MRRAVWISLCALAAGLWAGAAAAQDWASVGVAPDGTRVEIDVATVAMEGDIASSWIRETFRRPRRSPSGRTYSSMVARRLVDCKARRLDYESVAYYDARGVSLGPPQTAPSRNWQVIVPGTGADVMGQAACGLGKAERADDLRAGDWKPVGEAGGDPAGAYTMHVLMDEIYRLDDDHVVVITRSDYRSYQLYQGIPFRYTLNTAVVDCRRRLMGPASVSFFASPVLQVGEESVDRAQLKLEPVAPGSFAYKMHEQVCAAPTLAFEEDAEEGSASAVGFGTAWASNKGYLVTAAHVLVGGRSIMVYQNGEKLGPATLVLADPANDLAILRFTRPDGRRLRIIPLADRVATLGRTVFTLGYPAPDTMGQRVKMTSGEVSSTAGVHDDARYLQISVPVQPGNSGGPLLGFDGTAVGVVASKLRVLSDRTEAPPPENVNYAVKAAYLHPLLEDLPDLKNYDGLKPSASADDLIAQAQEAVFMIVVEK